jgi:hypothetical protein
LLNFPANAITLLACWFMFAVWRFTWAEMLKPAIPADARFPMLAAALLGLGVFAVLVWFASKLLFVFAL